MLVKGKILWFLFFGLPLREVKPSDKQDNERVGRAGGSWEGSKQMLTLWLWSQSWWTESPSEAGLHEFAVYLVWVVLSSASPRNTQGSVTMRVALLCDHCWSSDLSKSTLRVISSPVTLSLLCKSEGGHLWHSMVLISFNVAGDTLY